VGTPRPGACSASTLACLLTGAIWHGLLGGFTGFFPGPRERPVHNKNLINRQFKALG